MCVYQSFDHYSHATSYIAVYVTYAFYIHYHGCIIVCFCDRGYMRPECQGLALWPFIIMLIWPCATDQNTLCRSNTNTEQQCNSMHTVGMYKHTQVSRTWVKFMFECVQMQDIGAVQYMIFRMYYNNAHVNSDVYMYGLLQEDPSGHPLQEHH